jgi:hypothetical protein
VVIHATSSDLNFNSLNYTINHECRPQISEMSKAQEIKDAKSTAVDDDEPDDW